MVGGGWRGVNVDTPAADSVPTHLFKMLLVGDSGVGKSSIIKRDEKLLIKRLGLHQPADFVFREKDGKQGRSFHKDWFTDDSFQEEYMITIGVDFAVKMVDAPDGSKVKLQIWDTAGQERFRTITNSYYRGAHGIVVVYDSANRETFENAGHWIGEISRYSHEDVSVMLVGTKSDLASQREVSEEEAKTFAKENQLDLVEVSAKDNINIQQVFEVITSKMIEGHKERRQKKLATLSTAPKDVDHLVLKKESQRCGKSKCF